MRFFIVSLTAFLLSCLAPAGEHNFNDNLLEESFPEYQEAFRLAEEGLRPMLVNLSGNEAIARAALALGVFIRDADETRAEAAILTLDELFTQAAREKEQSLPERQLQLFAALARSLVVGVGEIKEKFLFSLAVLASMPLAQAQGEAQVKLLFAAANVLALISLHADPNGLAVEVIEEVYHKYEHFFTDSKLQHALAIKHIPQKKEAALNFYRNRYLQDGEKLVGDVLDRQTSPQAQRYFFDGLKGVRLSAQQNSRRGR